jgi:hypothetical protein
MKFFIKITGLITLFFSTIAFGQEEWIVRSENTDNNVRAEITTKSKTSIRNYSTKETVFPELKLFCEVDNPEISMQINWKRFISSFRNTEIGIKTDKNQINWTKFNIDKSGEITYLKSSRKLNNLIDNLNNKKRLTIEAEPYSEPSITVDFDITELKKYLNELSNLCIN